MVNLRRSFQIVLIFTYFHSPHQQSYTSMPVTIFEFATSVHPPSFSRMSCETVPLAKTNEAQILSVGAPHFAAVRGISARRRLGIFIVVFCNCSILCIWRRYLCAKLRVYHLIERQACAILYHCDDKVSAHYHEVYCGVITFGQGFNSMVDWSAVVPFRALDDCVRKTWPMRTEKHCECSCAGLCQSLKTRSGEA
jgi:hypothetical protein